MNLFNIIIWVLALFFAVGWTALSVFQRRVQPSSTHVTVGYWWLAIGAAVLGKLAVGHLIWFMPTAALVPLGFYQTSLMKWSRPTAKSLFVRSSIALVPALLLAVWLSGGFA